jgi:hypothetical protein
LSIKAGAKGKKKRMKPPQPYIPSPAEIVINVLFIASCLHLLIIHISLEYIYIVTEKSLLILGGVQ